MLQLWHSNFEEVAPISHYLINSLKNNNRFDIPDFLIIAQALDGYHKRFINKKGGKNIKKYGYDDSEHINRTHELIFNIKLLAIIYPKILSKISDISIGNTLVS